MGRYTGDWGQFVFTLNFVHNVNFGFKQFVTAVHDGHLRSNKSFITTDNIFKDVPLFCVKSLLNKNHIKSTDFVYFLLLMVVNIYKHMAKVVNKISQGSAVT